MKECYYSTHMSYVYIYDLLLFEDEKEQAKGCLLSVTLFISFLTTLYIYILDTDKQIHHIITNNNHS